MVFQVRFDHSDSDMLFDLFGDEYQFHVGLRLLAFLNGFTPSRVGETLCPLLLLLFAAPPAPPHLPPRSNGTHSLASSIAACHLATSWWV